MAIAIQPVQVPAITVGSTQDITVLGAGTCKGAIFFVTEALTAGTAANNAVLSIGACDGTHQYAHGTFGRHGVNPTHNKRRGISDTEAITEACVLLPTIDGVTQAEASFTAFITDGVQITWSNLPSSAYLVTAWLFFDSGADLTFYCNVATGLGPDTTVTSVEDPTFQPDMVIATTHGTTFDDTVVPDTPVLFGVACRKSPITQVCLDFFSNDADLTSHMGGAVSSNYFLYHGSHSNLSRALELTAFDALGFDVTHRAGTSQSDLKFGYVALAFNGAADYWCGVLDSPHETGNWNVFEPGFFPQFVGICSTLIGTANTHINTAEAGSFCISGFTDSAEVCVSLAEKHGTITSNTQSLVDDTRAINLPNDSGVAFPGFQSSDSTAPALHNTGWTINFTTVGPSTVKKWPCFAIENPNATPTDPPASNRPRVTIPGVFG